LYLSIFSQSLFSSFLYLSLFLHNPFLPLFPSLFVLKNSFISFPPFFSLLYLSFISSKRFFAIVPFPSSNLLSKFFCPLSSHLFLILFWSYILVFSNLPPLFILWISRISLLFLFFTFLLHTIELSISICCNHIFVFHYFP